jgi:aminoglycoside phosphotransferase (APT) family kinase protein
MDSLSKTFLSQETAELIVARHLGGGRKLARLEELKEGYFNAAYRLQLADGFQCVLKIAPPPEVRVLRYEKDILRTEVETLRLVRTHTDLPVPAILFHDESCALLPSPFYGMEFIAGTPLHKTRETLSPAEQAQIDRRLGDYLRQMNAIRGDRFGYYAQPETQSASWAAAFEQMLAGVLQDGRDADVKLPRPAEEILALARRHASALEEVTAPALVHWDLWDGNVFIDPQTKAITGIIDFERALWADPLMECNFGAFGFNRDFLTGYGCDYPFTPAQELRRTLYNVYLFLIMVIECTYRHYPTPDQENWARLRLAEELAKL